MFIHYKSKFHEYYFIKYRGNFLYIFGYYNPPPWLPLLSPGTTGVEPSQTFGAKNNFDLNLLTAAQISRFWIWATPKNLSSAYALASATPAETSKLLATDSAATAVWRSVTLDFKPLVTTPWPSVTSLTADSKVETLPDKSVIEDERPPLNTDTFIC